MISLYESILNTTKKKVGKFRENFQIDIIKEWFDKNVKLSKHATYKISDNPNTDGKYIVTIVGNESFFRTDLIFLGESTTNGLFEYNFEGIRYLLIKGTYLKHFDGFSNSTGIDGLSISECNSIDRIEGFPKCRSFSLTWCPNIKYIKFPIMPEYDGKGRRITTQGMIDIYQCPKLTTVEWSSSFFETKFTDCPILNTFKNAPEYAGTMSVEDCQSFTSLKGLPKHLDVLEIVNCSKFSSFKGTVKVVDNHIKIQNTAIQDFKNLPKVLDYIQVYKCNIKDWSFDRVAPGRCLWYDTPTPPSNNGSRPMFVHSRPTD